MLDSIYHMTIRLLLNHFFCVKMLKICHVYAALLLTSFPNVTKMSILMHGVISLPDATSYDKQSKFS